MSSDEFNKKHLDEAGMPAHERAGASRVLDKIRDNPGVLHRAEPPMGYEAELLAALNRKLDLQAKPAARKAPAKSRWNFFASPALSWTLTGVFAALAVTTIFNFRSSSRSEEGDLIARAAAKGDSEQVGDWAASMGDTALRRRVARADIDSVAEDLASKDDQKVVESALRDVAHRMGMK